MKQRMKRLLAIIMTILLVVQLMPLTAFAVTINSSESLTTDSTEDYEITSGGELVIEEGVTVSGTIQSKDPLGDAGGRVNNKGTISSGFGMEGLKVTTSGYIDGGIAAGCKSLTIENGATFGHLDLQSVTAGSVTVNGNFQVTNFVLDTSALNPSTTSTINITNGLSILGNTTLPSSVVLSINDGVRIDNRTTAIVTKVLCDGIYYEIPKVEFEALTLADIYKCTVSDDTVAFDAVEYGYDAVTAKNYIISNTGVADVYLEFPASGDIFTNFDVTMDDVTIENMEAMLLTAGSTATISVTPKTKLKVGAYSNSATIKVCTSSGDVFDEKTMNATFSVGKAVGTGSVKVSDIYYGGEISSTVTSDTNGTDKVTLEYKEKGAADDTYSKEKPSAVGDYVARATFAENDTYKEVKATTEFAITYLPAPENPYIIKGTEGKNNFFTTDVVIKPAKGYLISKSLDGDYADEIKYQKSIASGKIYLKKKSTGEKTGAIALEEILLDKKQPKFTNATHNKTYYAESHQVTVEDENLYKVTLNGKDVELDGTKVAFKLKSNRGIEVYTISAEDLAGNKAVRRLVIATEWMESNKIAPGESLKLYKNQAYTLDEGTWKVSGDSTNYAGGIQFYVNTEGEYTFEKVSE